MGNFPPCLKQYLSVPFLVGFEIVATYGGNKVQIEQIYTHILCSSSRQPIFEQTSKK